MRVMLSLLLVIAAGAGASAAFAQPVEAGDPIACTPANSVAVTVSALSSSARRLRNRCVALQGYRVGDAIFADQRALYHHVAGRSRRSQGVIGIPYPLIADLDRAGLTRGTYYGRVESCREAQRSFVRTSQRLQRNPPVDEIVLVHLYGFCASSDGPAVRVERADERPSADLRRLTGDPLRANLGSLAPIGQDYRYGAVLPWLLEVATNGCEARPVAVHAPPGGPREGEGVALHQPNLGPAQQGQVTSWCRSSPRQTALYAMDNGADAEGVALDVAICLCVTADCTGRWPVAAIDMGWAVQRPYLCQRVRLRPRSHSFDEEGRSFDFSDYSYEFMDDHITHGLWQEWGFGEPG